MKYIVAAGFIVFAAVVTAKSQPYMWTTFTSTSDVVDMEVLNGHIWAATKGGLADYDPSSGSFGIYTNTRGLAMNQCAAIGKDSYGFIWAGLSDGRITRLNPQTGDVRQIVDLSTEIFEITDILNVGDEVFVSANNGIYRFAYYPIVDNYRVLETIKVLNGFPGEARVSSLTTAGDYLYAGTQFGLARIHLGLSQYSAPASWENITTANSGLPENNVLALQGDLAGNSGSLNVATPSWIATMDENGEWHSQIIRGVVRFSMMDFDLAATSARVYERMDDQWSAQGDSLSNAVAIERMIENGDTIYWVGIGDGDAGAGGLTFAANPDTEDWIGPLRAPGIGGNFITTLAIGPGGRLWVGGGGFNSGVYSYDGHVWINHTKSYGYAQPFYNGNPTSIAFDDFGGAWVSTFGQGTGWLRGDSLITFNTTDSVGFSEQEPRLTGIPADPNFVVTRVARNAAGDIFMTNRISTTNLPLVRVPASWIARGNNSDPWEYFTPGPPQQPNYQVEVEAILMDPLERIWMGASHDGLFTYALDRADTATESDDFWFSYIPQDRQDPVTCFEPINKEVLSWAVDSQGYLWIGTVNGAYYSQGGVPYDLRQLHFICVVDLPVGNRVNAIHVDAQDNKWFGTDEGVAVLDRNFTWVHVFQTASSLENRSDLTSNVVTAITSNAATGEVWIGTTDGLSRYTSPYVSSSIKADIWPYPNPFRADGTQRMCLDPQRFGRRFDELRVLTISGRLVRKLTWSDMLDCPARGGWDGRNDDGDLVAGGVYILVATTNDGLSTTGKVAVLGK